MEIVKGKYSGFCAGVNYTYINALKELENGPLYCLGDIIHNKEVIKDLENKGMSTVSNISEVPNGSKVIFRAHGEPYSSYVYAKNHNIKVIDLTCPKVKMIHNKVNEYKKEYFIIIIGKKTHPEIIGTIGFCDNNYYVIENLDDLDKVHSEFIKSKMNKVVVISQTTFSSALFDSLVLKIKDIFNNNEVLIDKSICNATEKRQKECEDISKKVSLMLVIGSKHSSNTKELYNIAKKNCTDVFLIENVLDLNNIDIKSNKIGVVAGASTPNYLIDCIISNLVLK